MSFQAGLAIGVALGALVTAAVFLAPELLARWRQSGEVPPLAEWSSGRRKIPEGRGQPPWLDAQGSHEPGNGRP